MVKSSPITNANNIHQFLVVGRNHPSQENPNPKIFKMRIFANDQVRAKSKFWYFLKRMNKIKKAHGEILSVNEVKILDLFLDIRKRPNSSKNFRNCMHLQIQIRISHSLQRIQKH
jgi:large subunit ribosomal protein L18Ae